MHGMIIIMKIRDGHWNGFNQSANQNVTVVRIVIKVLYDGGGGISPGTEYIIL